jgi:hypothetical protein
MQDITWWLTPARRSVEVLEHGTYTASLVRHDLIQTLYVKVLYAST